MYFTVFLVNRFYNLITYITVHTPFGNLRYIYEIISNVTLDKKCYGHNKQNINVLHYKLLAQFVGGIDLKGLDMAVY